MSKKLLRIVIPTFNRPKLLASLLHVLEEALSDPRVEVVVVDDCSEESSKSLLRTLSEDYPSSHFLFLKKNTGGAGARNAGACNGGANWIWFVDDDDVVTGSTVLAVLGELEKVASETKMVFLSANYIGDGFNRTVVPNGKNIFKQFARYGNEVNTSCTIFRYGFFNELGGWDGKLVAGQDTDLLLRASEFSDAYVLPGLHVDIINHAQERITTNPRKQMKGKAQFLLKHYKRLHPVRSLRYALTFIFAYPYIRAVIGR